MMGSIVIITVSACNFLMTDVDTKQNKVCNDFELPRYELPYNVMPIECAKQSQIEIIKKWLPTHQDWQINKIRCKIYYDQNKVEEKA
jgi:hypothetical protein